MFRRLSVFPRAFTLSAAEAVVDEPGLDVLDLLDSLVGKSLVRATEPEPVTGEPDLRHARDRARVRPRAPRGRAARPTTIHARHAPRRAATSSSCAVRSTGRRRWRAGSACSSTTTTTSASALDWADRARDVDTLLHLAAALGPFWRSHCHFSEGRRWLDRALTLSAGQRTDLRSDLLNGAGYLSRARGDYDVAEAQYRESLGDPRGARRSCRGVGVPALHRQRRLRPRRRRRRGGLVAPQPRRARRHRRHRAARRRCSTTSASRAHHRGADAEAIELYDEVQELARRDGLAPSCSPAR